MPTVLITGGTGMIGRNLTRHLTEKKYNVIILTRKIKSLSENPAITYALWNIEKQEIDKSAVQKADYIIHLAGAGVMNKRWTKKYKQEIVNSRTRSSNLLIKILRETENNVKAIVSASAIGWYGEDVKPLIHEKGFIETDPPDEGFLGNTCKLWEESIEPVAKLSKRLVKLRLGIVLSNDGGALDEFKKPIRFGIAGILGNGKQVISWIDIDDLCRMFISAIENVELNGSYNAVSPQPVTNKKLTIELAKKYRKGLFIPMYVPAFFLNFFLGKRSIEILKSATVNCKKIKATGFRFLYPSIEAALEKEMTS